ncbi:MAG: hypothetical protein ACI4J8_06810 [Oscillospiraceae bacterium]
MSDEKYSLDDILAEVDRKRSSKSAGTYSGYNGSVTEIIGGSELDEVLRTGKQKPSATAAAEEKRPEPVKPEATAKQLSEQEENARRAAEIAAAADRKKKQAAEKAEKKERELREKREKRNAQTESAKAAKQRTEDEVVQRIAQSVSDAADKKKHTTEHEETADIGASVDASKLFGEPEIPQEKPDDDVIVFHSKEDVVTTETMELKKLRRIEEINKALLNMDMGAQTNDELLDSLNPMDSRAKAAEEVKSNEEAEEIGDTRAVAGNELKKLAIGAEEHIKEYTPSASKSKKSEKEKRVDEFLFTPRTGVQKKNEADSLVNTLNKQLEARRESGEAADRTVVINDLSEVGKAPNEPLNIDDSKLIDTSVLGGSASDDDARIEQVRKADELAQSKKKRLSSFMLDDIGDDDADSVEEANDEEYEDEIDLDDESVINERLGRESKGLISRLIVLGGLFIAALFIAITNEFNIDLGAVTNIISKRYHPDYFLYAYLIIGILSLSVCSSVIQNGFARLLKLRTDSDTLCAFAHISAILALIPYLTLSGNVQRGRSHVYLLVSLAALIFNTVSKLCILKAAQRNFRFTSGDGAKYFVQHSSDGAADKLAGTAVDGMPEVASMRKTEMLCDFIISTYCEDVSDRLTRVFVPITLITAVAGGFIAYFTGTSQYVMDNVSWAATVASAIFSIGAGFTGSFIVTLPLLAASRKLNANNAAILGYNAIEEFSDVNACLVEAKSLFPAKSVKINNIWDYNKHRSANAPKIAIDEAIIYAASLSVTADSVLSDAFFNMLNYKHQLLKQVTECVYESNLGIMGTIERRRVLLGNREHMKSHHIVVPDINKESAANKNNDEVIYLAVNGEVCMLFFVELSANRQVKTAVRELAKHDVTLIIKTVDGMVTPSVIAELFEIDAARCRIIPFEFHESFKELTKYTSTGSAAVSCDGTFTAFSSALCAAKNLHRKINVGCIISAAGCALGIALALIFMLFANYSMFGCFAILLYNLAFLAITAGVQAIGKI